MINESKKITKKLLKNCLNCNVVFSRYPTKKRPVPMFCSKQCANSSPIQLKKKEGKYYMQRPGMKGENAPTFGKNWKIKDTSKMTSARVTYWEKSELRKKKMSEEFSGKNNHKWIENRSLIKGRHNRSFHDPEYKQWHMSVKNRDGWKCCISNGDCSGRLEAHHILSWKDHPELRYEINNGITLCHAHHPRKRSDEVKLSPYFQELVASLDQNRNS